MIAPDDVDARARRSNRGVSRAATGTQSHVGFPARTTIGRGFELDVNTAIAWIVRNDVNSLPRCGDGRMLLLRLISSQSQVRLPGGAPVSRTLVIDLRLSAAVVIPDHVHARGVIGGDAP